MMGSRAKTVRDLAARLGVSRATAYRRMEQIRGAQSQPDVLRVVEAEAVIGNGARRKVLAVEWPG
jgi:predicted DNA-binding transcriptional regulator YafY